METAATTRTHAACRYLVCPLKKGRPKKHVDVCRKCRRSRSCKAFQNYIQPGLFPGWE